MSTEQPTQNPTVASIEVAAPGDVDEDEFNELEWDAESSASASITSSVLQHSFEHGRRVRMRFAASRSSS